MNYKDFSFDIETLGTTPYSNVLAIGVVGFNRRSATGMSDDIDTGVYITIDVSDSHSKGLRVDPATVLWWMQQSDEARKAFQVGSGASLNYALGLVNSYLNEHGFDKNCCVWGNGSGFDINLLEDAYRVSTVQCPWKYWQARDLRTLVDVSGIDKKALVREGTHHNALADAIHQARLAQMAFRVCQASTSLAADKPPTDNSE